MGRGHRPDSRGVVMLLDTFPGILMKEVIVLRRAWLVLTLLVFAAACDSEPANNLEAAAAQVTSVDEGAELNSSNSQPIERLAQKDLPGAREYEANCANCHDGNVKKAPHRDMIALMTPDAILKAMTDGVMKVQASSLTSEQQRVVAEYLSGVELSAIPALPACDNSENYVIGASKSGGNWGMNLSNQRMISAEQAGITSQNVSTLKTRWAIAMPGANRVRSQPTFAGGLILVGSHSGDIYALSPETGCQVWRYSASAEVRTSIVVSEQADTAMAYFGDVLGNVYGINALDGTEVWKIRADEHPNATITGAPTYYEGVVYVPISSLEVSNAIDPYYVCCTFRGSVLAVDGMTGEEKWRSYTILEEPSIFGQNPLGTDIIGPSGAAVWNSPSIDVAGRQLIIGTAENASSPATGTSDALIAMDLATGDINWIFQGTANDAWNVACDSPRPENCPEEDGPDFDFGGASVVLESSKHGRMIVAGQKSGMVHAISADTGELIWQTRAGRGGIQGGVHFGIAVSGETVLVPVSDMPDGRTYPNPDAPGLHAINANTGEIIWSVIHENRCEGRQFCDPGISQVVTAIDDMVIAGAMDGVARAYAIDSGEILWELDTTSASFTSTSGAQVIAGSFSGGAGPVAYDGLLLLSSGYGIYNHMAGNLLLALEVSND